MSRSILVRAVGTGKHAHLSEGDLKTLFGPDAGLEFVRDLDGSGQFLSDKKVTIITSKGEAGLSVIGPTRRQTQIELSYTEARPLGLRPPLRENGELSGSDPCELRGALGETALSEGVIVSRRHIHMIPSDMETLGISDGATAWVRFPGERELIFGKVSVILDERLPASVMHLDFDEMNAAGLQNDSIAQVFASIAF